MEIPDWWKETEEVLRNDPRWEFYKVLKRLEAVEESLEIVGVLCTAIWENLSEFDTQPATAKINMEGTNMADIQVADTNGPLSAVVAFADVHGHPTSPQGVPAWSSSDPAVASVDASADPSGLAAVVTVLGPGATVISVASTNTDGTVIGAAGTVTVTSGPPLTGEVSFGNVEPPVEPPVV